MKKGFLLLSTLIGMAHLTSAQKLALYEEFSGENCGPCAAANPTLMNLLYGAGNESKVLLIKYQSPIPSAGPIYNENTADVQNRMSYYTVNSAPQGLLNGAKVGTGANAGHVALTTQAMIDAAAAEATPFTIVMGTPTYTGSNFSVTVSVTANAATSYTNLKLRFSLIEDLEFSTAPGSNGETSFHHVMRKMYPNATGTTVPGTFTAGQTQTFTITGTIPAYVSAEQERRFIAWVQDDATKKVLQSAKTALLPAAANAIASEGINIVDDLKCGTSGTYNAEVTIKNTGTANLTSATIYWKANNGTYTSQAWAGNLAPGATTNVAINAINLNTIGANVITDSVANPNGTPDPYAGNNVSSTYAYLLGTTPNALPLTNDFETENNAWVSYTKDNEAMYRVNLVVSGTPRGYNNSTYGLFYVPFDEAPGKKGYYIFPKADLVAGPKALDFYQSYALRTGAGSETLEVIYSTDCGATWQNVWSKSGADLATTTPTNAQTAHIPTASTWKLRSVDVTNVPNGADIALRSTSGGGNYIFVDNITLRTGAVTSVNDVVSEGSVSLFPSPVQSDLNVKMTLNKASNVVFNVVNALGQVVTTSTQNFAPGNQNTIINVANLAAGVYILNIVTPEGTTQQKFVKK